MSTRYDGSIQRSNAYCKCDTHNLHGVDRDVGKQVRWKARQQVVRDVQLYMVATRPVPAEVLCQCVWVCGCCPKASGGSTRLVVCVCVDDRGLDELTDPRFSDEEVRQRSGR